MLNVRVYGILINEQQQVLVSDEYIRGMYITKFCGGGLEQGEGTRDCLKREFLEEMNLAIEVTDHIYTTDFYQASAFYYFVKSLGRITVPLRTAPFQFDEEQMATYEKTGEIETFRFINISKFDESCLTLPIDKIVAGMIVKSNG